MKCTSHKYCRKHNVICLLVFPADPVITNYHLPGVEVLWKEHWKPGSSATNLLRDFEALTLSLQSPISSSVKQTWWVRLRLVCVWQSSHHSLLLDPDQTSLIDCGTFSFDLWQPLDPSKPNIPTGAFSRLELAQEIKSICRHWPRWPPGSQLSWVAWSELCQMESWMLVCGIMKALSIWPLDWGFLLSFLFFSFNSLIPRPRWLLKMMVGIISKILDGWAQVKGGDKGGLVSGALCLRLNSTVTFSLKPCFLKEIGRNGQTHVWIPQPTALGWDVSFSGTVSGMWNTTPQVDYTPLGIREKLLVIFWIHSLIPQPIGCLTSEKLLDFSLPQFLIHQTGKS